MPVTPAPPAKRRDAVASAGLLAALAVSQIGFLGYYDLGGFHTFAPVLVLAALMVALAAWAGATALWSDNPVLVLRRAGLVFVPGVLVALLAAADCAPARTFSRVTWLLVTIAPVSTVFAVVLLTFGERIQLGGDGMNVRLLDIGENGLGVAVAGRSFYFDGTLHFRTSGLSSNTNGAGIAAAVALACLLIPDSAGIARARVRATVAAILVAAIVLTLSRGALLFVAVSGVLFAAYRLGGCRAALAVIAVVALLPIGVAVLIDSGALYAAVGAGAGEAETIPEIIAVGEREGVSRIMYQAIATVWPHGLGFGLSQEAIFAPRGLATSAHSTQLAIVAETGIVGLALLLVAWLGYPIVRLATGSANGLAFGLAIVVTGLYAHQAFDSAAFRFHPLHLLIVYFIGVLANPLVSARGAVAADGG